MARAAPARVGIGAPPASSTRLRLSSDNEYVEQRGRSVDSCVIPRMLCSNAIQHWSHALCLRMSVESRDLGAARNLVDARARDGTTAAWKVGDVVTLVGAASGQNKTPDCADYQLHRVTGSAADSQDHGG